MIIVLHYNTRYNISQISRGAKKLACHAAHGDNSKTAHAKINVKDDHVYQRTS